VNGRRFERSLEAFVAESEAAEITLRGLPPAAFDGPTRCPAWDVRALTGHMLRDADRILDYLAAPPPPAADTAAAAYFRRYDPVVEAPAVAARSIERAAAFASTQALVGAFASTWRAAAERARAAGGDRLVQVAWGPALRLDEYLETRVLEMAVHGLDLADALGVPAWLSPGGGAIVRALLTELLGGDPPPAWSDIELAEKGTGRRVLSPADLAALGASAARFPLLA
jgi:uncharacterized protein (TIGR03083 family)